MSDLLMRDIYKNFGETKVIHGINIEISDEDLESAYDLYLLSLPTPEKRISHLSCFFLGFLVFLISTNSQYNNFQKR